MATRKIFILETAAKTTGYITRVMITSGTDSVLYSVLNATNVSLNSILPDIYGLKAAADTSDLENKIANGLKMKVRTVTYTNNIH